MANILKVSMIEKIKALSGLGWSSRKISRELGVHRDTVKKYRPIKSNCTRVTTGNSEEFQSKCTGVTAGVSQSKCAKYDAYIRERMKLGLSAQRIFQDLQMERSFDGSYESVKRYVRTLSECDEVPFRRMEVLPGTECQVDYGAGAWIVGADGINS